MEMAQLEETIARLARQVQALTKELAQIRQQIRSSANTVMVETRRVELNGFRQADLRRLLLARLGSDVELPPTRGWAASPDILMYILDHLEAFRPKLVVEVGSGVSTVVIGSTLRKLGVGHLYSLEHDEEHRAKTAESIVRHGLESYVTLLHAPLVPWKPDRETMLGTEWRWYEVPNEVGALEQIELLVVDGPPELTGPHARYPALPQFRSQLSADATVLLDDAIRAAETEIAQSWSVSFGMSLTLRNDFEKGLAVLRPLRPGQDETDYSGG